MVLDFYFRIENPLVTSKCNSIYKMNCDTCAEMFTTMSDLIQHVLNVKHSYRCSHFFCTPCSMPLFDLSNVIQHIGSDEHSFMTLATGIYFDTKSERSHDLNHLFPPLFCCLLCSSRDNSYRLHAKNSTHLKVTPLMRVIMSSKTIYYSESNSDRATQKFINKLISIKQLLNNTNEPEDVSDTFDCELCNIYFNNDECYQQHLGNESHKRVEQFITKLSNILKEVELIGFDSDVKVTETFSNSLPPLYYCELCCVWLDSTVQYTRHAKSITHTRIQELCSKVSNKKDGEIITLRGVNANARDSVFYRSKEYCKLCTIWGATGYRRHLKDVGHIRIEKFLNNLTKEDRKFLIVYMNAQATLKVDNSTPPNYCVLCNILCFETAEFRQHLDSPEHKYVKKYYPTEKDVGGKKAPLTLRQNYYATLQKYPRYKQSSPPRETESSSEESGSGDNTDRQEHYCELCDFLCYNALQYDKHLNGDQHKRMRRLLSKKVKAHVDTCPCKSSSNSHPLQYKCELCEVFSSNYEKYDLHLNSAIHKKNQWLLFVLKQRPI